MLDSQCRFLVELLGLDGEVMFYKSVNGKSQIESFKRVLALLALVLLSLQGFADDRLSCPKVSAAQRPALVFVEGPPDRENLYVARFLGYDLKKDRVLSSRYLQVTQLDNAIFLACTQEEDKTGRVYVMDFRKGVVRLLAESTRFNCLRAEPRRKKAMLCSLDTRAGEIKLFELDLEGLKMTLRKKLSRLSLGADFGSIRTGMKLSPDFTRIAYTSNTQEPAVRQSSDYVLRVLDLSTMQAEDIDSGIHVRISWASSFSEGRPPLEWLNDKEIVYQHMLPYRPEENQSPHFKAAYVVKRANIETKKITECLRKELDLTLDGGSLQMNPLNGRLIYHNRWILDLKKKDLTAKNLPFSIVKDSSNLQTKVLQGDSVVYKGLAPCVSTCVSPSGRHFAYSLRWKDREPAAEIYTKIERRKDPVLVGKGSYWPTRPVGWIE